jgi:hypothetical protein
MTATTDRPTTSPPALVAIAIAARKSGDRELERSALRELREGHGIALSFVRDRWREVRHGR